MPQNLRSKRHRRNYSQRDCYRHHRNYLISIVDCKEILFYVWHVLQLCNRMKDSVVHELKHFWCTIFYGIRESCFSPLCYKSNVGKNLHMIFLLLSNREKKKNHFWLCKLLITSNAYLHPITYIVQLSQQLTIHKEKLDPNKHIFCRNMFWHLVHNNHRHQNHNLNIKDFYWQVWK